MVIPTDPRYWDCECKADYMHPKSKSSCNTCNARAENQPDSRIGELLTTFRDYKLPNRRMKYARSQELYHSPDR